MIIVVGHSRKVKNDYDLLLLNYSLEDIYHILLLAAEYPVEAMRIIIPCPQGLLLHIYLVEILDIGIEG